MSTKKNLQKLISDIKTKQFREGEAKGLTQSIGEELKKQFGLTLDGMNQEVASAVKSQLAEAVSKIKIDIPKQDAPIVNVPETIIPPFPAFPDIPAPIVNVAPPVVNVAPPVVNIPETKFPEFPKYPEEIGLRGVDKMQPLPVMMMDNNGKQFQFPTGASGGKGDFFTIKGFSQSAYTDVTNADGRLRVSVETGGSGITDSELRASSVPVAQASGATWSTAIKEIFGSTITSDVLNADNRIRVSLETGGSGLTDSELRASAVPVSQLSGATWSVSVNDIFRTTAASNLINSDDRLRVSLETGGSGLTDSELRATSVPVSQVSGTNWSVSVVDIFGSVSTNVINPDGRVKVELPTGSSGLTDTELRASAVPVSQLSGASWSVVVNEIFGSVGTSVINPDGRLKVEVPTGSSGLTDTELRATAVPVSQVSGSQWSVVVKEIFGSVISSLLNGDNRIPVSVETGGSGITDSEIRATALPVTQVSGASWSVFATGAGASFFAEISNPDGRVKVELPTGSSGLTDTELRAVSVPVSQVSGSAWSTEVMNTVTVTGTLTSTGAYLLNGDGSYRGTMPIEGAVTVNGALNSVIAVGPTLHDDVDTGSAPQKIGGVAVTTANPTAVAGGDIVNFRADDLGRQITRPIQVRDLITTAYASLTNGTETTLLTGSASTFHDLIYVVGANQSDAAVLVDFRCGTAGTVILSLEIPAKGTAGIACPVPLPMPEVAQAWTADMPDISGTTVNITALFSKEI